MADLPRLKYKVVAGHNPQTTGGTILRPVITDRPTISLTGIVDYAKTAGYVRGQTKDLEGLLGGFIQAMQDRAKQGYSINVNDWFIISGQLKGQVDQTGQLTAANDYHVTIHASKDLKVGIDQFSWTNVDDTSARVKIEHLQSVGGARDKEIFANAKIMVSGKNLVYTAASDSIVATWNEVDDDGAIVPKSVTLVPDSSGFSTMQIPWSTSMATAPVGTVITFTFTLRQGKTEGTVIPASANAKVISNG